MADRISSPSPTPTSSSLSSVHSVTNAGLPTIHLDQKEQEDRFWGTLCKIATIAAAIFLALLALGVKPLTALFITAGAAGLLSLLPCSRDYLRAQHLDYASLN